MTKTDAPALPSPGSRPLKNAKYEKYCRLRASAQPRIAAYREVGWQTKDNKDVYSNACALERRPGIRDRIAYLTRQAEDRIAEKRARIEQQLWEICEGNIADFFETYDAVKRDHTGQPVPADEGGLSIETRVRPKLLSDLPPELAKLIEEVRPDSRGRLIPKLYSKHQANKELRAMLNLTAKSEAPDVTKLTNEELIESLARQAKELGVEIDLSYNFSQRPPAAKTDGEDSGQVIDHESESDKR